MQPWSNHGATKTPRKEAKKHDTQKEEILLAMDEVKNPPRSEDSEPPTTHKVWFHPGQRILWHLRQKIPGLGKFKIRWAGPYLIQQVYDNGSVDVTTLQGVSLGRVNMNKLKPYQELDSTQAYALQILACHILEAGIRAEQNQLHNKNDITKHQSTSFSQPNGGVILHNEPIPYPDQYTRDAEDLEVHRVMLEGYWVQPSTLEGDKFQNQNFEGTYSPNENNGPMDHLRNTFGNSIETPKEDDNPLYPTPLDLKEGRADQFSK